MTAKVCHILYHPLLSTPISHQDMWIARESQLRAQIQDLTSVLESKESLTAELVTEIRDMRSEINSLVSSIDEREEEQRELEKQAGKLTGRNRSNQEILLSDWLITSHVT